MKIAIYCALLAGSAAVLLGSLNAAADSLPAVSGPNGKVSVEGGSFDDNGAGIALGSYAIPLGPSFGLQADGAIGVIDDDTLGGGGLHLFTRQPEKYLLGVYGSYHTWDSINIWRVAAEAELYVNRFSLSGLAGYENVDVPTFSGGLLVLTQDDKHFFGTLDLGYYITDDFKIYGGYRYLNETSFAGAGAEYLVRGQGVPISLFAKSDFGNSDYTRITGGLKVYFGSDPDKSLIDRQRMDDPENYLPVFPRLVKQSSSPTPPPGPTQCTVTGGDAEVTSPANGACICPSGTALAGQAPFGFSGTYYCSPP